MNPILILRVCKMGFVLVVGRFFFFFKAVSHHLFCTWRVAAQQAKVASEARYLESRECGGNSGQVKSRRGQRGGVCDSIIDNHGVLVCETAWHERAEADSELLRYRWRNPAVGEEKF